jgi:hypothetical protein
VAGNLLELVDVKGVMAQLYAENVMVFEIIFG